MRIYCTLNVIRKKSNCENKFFNNAVVPSREKEFREPVAADLPSKMSLNRFSHGLLFALYGTLSVHCASGIKQHETSMGRLKQLKK